MRYRNRVLFLLFMLSIITYLDRVAIGLASGRIQADPFPNNVIDPSLINPVAKAVLEYIAKPLTTGSSDGTSNFQNPGLLETIKYATNTVRVDHIITDKQRLYARAFHCQRRWGDRAFVHGRARVALNPRAGNPAE